MAGASSRRRAWQSRTQSAAEPTLGPARQAARAVSVCPAPLNAHKKHYVNFWLAGSLGSYTNWSLGCHVVVTWGQRIHTESMGKVIRFPSARRRADIGRGLRVFEAVYDQERSLSLQHLLVLQALSVAAVLTTVLQV